MAFRSPGVLIPSGCEVVAQLLRQLKKFSVGVSVSSATETLIPQPVPSSRESGGEYASELAEIRAENAQQQ